MTKTFEFNKETVNNIVTATKYDRLIHETKNGYKYESSVVNEQLAEMNRRGEVLHKIMDFFKENPKARVRMKDISKVVYNDKWCVNYINHLVQKLVQGGFLKREVEENAIVLERETRVYSKEKGYHYETEKRAVLAKIAYFSLAE